MHLPEIFSSPDTLRRAFEKGLDRQLEDDSPGTFILVLANSIFDKKIFNKFKDRLAKKFEQAKHNYPRNIKQNNPQVGAVDDITVITKLAAMEFDELRTTEYRTTEHWRLQFNQLRSLRPKRISDNVVSKLIKRFDETAFHFNKPFLDKEIFWSGKIDGKPVKLLYNKFPFATIHGLLVPEPEQKHPQYLTQDMHNFISTLSRQLGNSIPNMGIAYNAYGAGASINHLHFQTFILPQTLPVLLPHWRHNGGSIPYPVTCQVFSNSTDAWCYINHLHLNNITYNLIYQAEKIICLARKYQGSYEAPEWAENFAWNELCGCITTFNHNEFQTLSDEKIWAALSSLHLTIPLNYHTGNCISP